MSATDPSPRLRFVLDENLSPRLAQALALLDESAEVQHLTEVVEIGTDDTVFLPILGKDGRFLVTRDTRQRTRPQELEAWKKHAVGSFVLGGKNLESWELVTQVVVAWPRMKEAAVKTRRPFAYRVRPAAGKLEPIPL